jgi:hypothetical protein
MLRLVVHGTAQYGYDYDATINQRQSKMRNND